MAEWSARPDLPLASPAWKHLWLMVIPLQPLDSASSAHRLQSCLRAVVGCFLKAGSGIISYFESKHSEVEIVIFLKHKADGWVEINLELLSSSL